MKSLIYDLGQLSEDCYSNPGLEPATINEQMIL